MMTFLAVRGQAAVLRTIHAQYDPEMEAGIRFHGQGRVPLQQGFVGISDRFEGGRAWRTTIVPGQALQENIDEELAIFHIAIEEGVRFKIDGLKLGIFGHCQCLRRISDHSLTIFHFPSASRSQAVRTIENSRWPTRTGIW